MESNVEKPHWAAQGHVQLNADMLVVTAKPTNMQLHTRQSSLRPLELTLLGKVVFLWASCLLLLVF